jgi:hypothetical protein
MDSGNVVVTAVVAFQVPLVGGVSGSRDLGLSADILNLLPGEGGELWERKYQSFAIHPTLR